jgi:hypothetical protein
MLVVRVLAALALGVSGAVHLDLAGSYDRLGDTLTVGTLFRVQGVVALLVAGWLLLRRRDRLPLLVALVLAAASTAAVVLSVYVRVPAVGPLPELYEPVWYPEKSASAVAAAVAAVLSGLLLAGSRSRGLP